MLLLATRVRYRDYILETFPRHDHLAIDLNMHMYGGKLSTNQGRQVSRSVNFLRTTACTVALASPLVSAIPTDTLA